jgi:hypothetical protein
MPPGAFPAFAGAASRLRAEALRRASAQTSYGGVKSFFTQRPVGVVLPCWPNDTAHHKARDVSTS